MVCNLQPPDAKKQERRIEMLEVADRLIEARNEKEKTCIQKNRDVENISNTILFTFYSSFVIVCTKYK